MEKLQTVLQDDQITLRLLQPHDIDRYYEAGFSEPDEQSNYYTATTQAYSKETIAAYVNRIVDDPCRYDFLIEVDHEILGEIVINEIDWDSKNAGFRIALFHSKYFNSGYGKRAMTLILPFAFQSLQLHRLELEVFSYNPRAKHLYEAMGFQVEGCKKEALFINGEYHDIYLMAIVHKENRISL